MSAPAAASASASSPTPLEEATEALKRAGAKVTAAVEEQDLIEKQIEPAATYDMRVAKAKVRVAEAKVRVAEAKVRVAEAQPEPAGTYDARVAKAEVDVKEAKADVKEAKADVAKAEADVAKVKYEIEKAKVEALLAAKSAAGDTWTAAREDELLGAIKDKETALQAWNDAKTTNTLIMQTAAAARPTG